MDALLVPPPSVGAPTPRRVSRRLWILTSLLLVESALAVLLQTFGWFETGGLLRQAACALLALLPLAAAVALVARRGFRFSVQVMLIATALLSLFMWISVLPLYEALASRRGAQALAAANVALRDYCSNEHYFAALPYDPRPPAPPRPTTPTVPFWLRPLAGEALRLPVDAAVREVKLHDDGQVAAFVANAERFRSLTYIGVHSGGISPFAEAALCGALAQAPGLVQLHVTCPVPPGLLKSVPGVRCLWIDSGTSRVNMLGAAEMNELAALPQLSHLDLRHIRISDDDLQLLAQSGSLRQIVLRAEGPTDQGVERLRLAMPACEVKLIPPPSP